MESNYKVAYNAEWNKLKKLNPIEVANRLNVQYCIYKRQYIVAFFEKDYIVDFESESIYRKKDGKVAEISDAIIILNYLTYSTEYIINTNKWVSLKEIPNGGALFYPAFYKSSILELIKKFGEDLNGFEKNALKLGGSYIKLGDKGYKFKVLPKVNICIAVWEGDDEISSNATLLFEPAVQYLMHIETVIGLGMCVSDKLISINYN